MRNQKIALGDSPFLVSNEREYPLASYRAGKASTRHVYLSSCASNASAPVWAQISMVGVVKG